MYHIRSETTAVFGKTNHADIQCSTGQHWEIVNEYVIKDESEKAIPCFYNFHETLELYNDILEASWDVLCHPEVPMVSNESDCDCFMSDGEL